MKIDMAKFADLISELGSIADQARAIGGGNTAELIRSIVKRFEECTAYEDDGPAVVKRDKAALKALQDIAASVEGIRSEMAKAREAEQKVT